MDWQGQKLAEQLMQIMLLAFAMTAFATGYVMASFQIMILVYAGGVILTTLVTVPNWPFFNRHPLNWLDPSEVEKHPKPQPPSSSSSLIFSTEILANTHQCDGNLSLGISKSTTLLLQDNKIIRATIFYLSKDDGSTKKKIIDYIKQDYGELPNLPELVALNLKHLTESGEVEKVNNSYRFLVVLLSIPWKKREVGD
ncbi:uncharacterized protein LOC133286889 isoform X2 [Gastrolobium bilobum]|uniref:uncharacterized protein LOC133286889 isoform X2 n=1 Tax=Gastrolobium bilobum TaxID=150636 RepID=UPI002AAF9333|nr:uncharacterized protein LOC133286889 isoform X2 [Gastrolobium bilobum]